MHASGNDKARNLLSAQTSEAFHPDACCQTLEIRTLGCTEHLHPFFSEVAVKSGQRQARPIDCGLANLTMETDLRTFQLHLQLLRVRRVEAFHSHNWHALPQIARGSNGLG